MVQRVNRLKSDFVFVLDDEGATNRKHSDDDYLGAVTDIKSGKMKNH